MKKCILFLRKGAYPYWYMNEWENLMETSLPEKDDDYSNHLNKYKQNYRCRLHACKKSL